MDVLACLQHIVVFIIGEFGLVARDKMVRPGSCDYSITTPSKYLHVYVPRQLRTSAGEMIVFVHGGGWSAGTIDPDSRWYENISYAGLGRRLASNGNMVALVGYPLCETRKAVRYGFYVGLALFACVLAHTLAALGPLSLAFWYFLAVPCYVFSVGVVHSRAMPLHQNARTTIHTQLCVVTQQLQRLSMRYPLLKLTVVGHSAGAHLVALAVAAASTDSSATWRSNVTRVVALSGVYSPGLMFNGHSPWLVFLVKKFLPAELFVGWDLTPYIQIGKATHLPLHWSIVTARDDNPVLVVEADSITGQLTRKGCRVDRKSDLGHGHGSGLVWAADTWNYITTLMEEREKKDIAARLSCVDINCSCAACRSAQSKLFGLVVSTSAHIRFAALSPQPLSVRENLKCAPDTVVMIKYTPPGIPRARWGLWLVTFIAELSRVPSSHIGFYISDTHDDNTVILVRHDAVVPRG